jgi:hypothetical protein
MQDESRGQNIQLIFLAILSVLILLAGRYNLLNPRGARAARDAVAAWWLVNGRMVIAGVVLAIILLLVLLVWRWKLRIAEKRAILDRVASGPTVQLLPRADWKAVPTGDNQIWARIANALPPGEHISFEICGNADQSYFALHGSKEGVSAAITQIVAELPGLFYRPLAEEQAGAIYWIELSPVSFERAVRAAGDPLRAVLLEIASLRHGHGMVQIIARRNASARLTLRRKAFAARDEELESNGMRALRKREAKELEVRAQDATLDCTVRVIGISKDHFAAQQIARRLAIAISSSFGPENPLRPVHKGADARPVIRREPGKMQVWAARELAALAHLPDRDAIQLAPRLLHAPARYLPADPEMRYDESKHRTALLEDATK